MPQAVQRVQEPPADQTEDGAGHQPGRRAQSNNGGNRPFGLRGEAFDQPAGNHEGEGERGFARVAGLSDQGSRGLRRGRGGGHADRFRHRADSDPACH